MINNIMAIDKQVIVGDGGGINNLNLTDLNFEIQQLQFNLTEIESTLDNFNYFVINSGVVSFAGLVIDHTRQTWKVTYLVSLSPNRQRLLNLLTGWFNLRGYKRI